MRRRASPSRRAASHPPTVERPPRRPFSSRRRRRGPTLRRRPRASIAGSTRESRASLARLSLSARPARPGTPTVAPSLAPNPSLDHVRSRSTFSVHLRPDSRRPRRTIIESLLRGTSCDVANERSVTPRRTFGERPAALDGPVPPRRSSNRTRHLRARLVRDGQRANLGRSRRRFESDPRAQEDADDDHIIVRTI